MIPVVSPGTPSFITSCLDIYLCIVHYLVALTIDIWNFHLVSICWVRSDTLSLRLVWWGLFRLNLKLTEQGSLCSWVVLRVNIEGRTWTTCFFIVTWRGICGLLGVSWVMPFSVLELLVCWIWWFGGRSSREVWHTAPLCLLLWCI